MSLGIEYILFKICHEDHKCDKWAWKASFTRHVWLKSFQSILLADQITVIVNEMNVWTSRFANAL